MFSVNDYWSFKVHGGGGHEGGIVEGMNDLLVFIDSLSGHSASEIFALLFPGIAGMANYHPLVVHYPIALLTLFLVIELAAIIFKIASWRTVASGFLYLGTVCAAITVYLGFKAAETVPHDDVVHAIMERHEGFGVAILSLAALLSIWRMFATRNDKIQQNSFFVLLAGLLTVLIVLGADLGGLMVYRHAVGVQVMPVSGGVSGTPAIEDDHHHAHDHEHVH